MYIDHIVIWAEDTERALNFYVDTLGLEAIREKEFLQGQVRFPSVRINEKSILDIMQHDKLLPLVQKFTGSARNAGGGPVNHICLSMSHEQYDVILARLKDRNVKTTTGGERVFGAQGLAQRSTYFNDPDGNVIEIRFYDS